VQDGVGVRYNLGQRADRLRRGQENKADLAGYGCVKPSMPAQTSTVACGAAFLIQAAVSGDSSEPRVSR
jgi:hypothetical protein